MSPNQWFGSARILLKGKIEKVHFSDSLKGKQVQYIGGTSVIHVNIESIGDTVRVNGWLEEHWPIVLKASISIHILK